MTARPSCDPPPGDSYVHFMGTRSFRAEAHNLDERAPIRGSVESSEPVLALLYALVAEPIR